MFKNEDKKLREGIIVDYNNKFLVVAFGMWVVFLIIERWKFMFMFFFKEPLEKWLGFSDLLFDANIEWDEWMNQIDYDSYNVGIIKRRWKRSLIWLK